MATVVFSAAGAALGSATGIPYGAAIGRAIGGGLGSAMAAKMGGTTRITKEGPRLEELAVQSSAYGRPIPLVVGTMRLAGNVIWARPIKEIATTTTTTSVSGGGAGKGGGGGRVSESNTTYSYYGTVAVAICEGPIDSITRVWADTKLLDQASYTMRFYTGTESQAPDSLIEAYEGTGATPAYRGTAYVVFEDLPLADFGNRLPNFTFEVRRSMQMAEIDGQPLERHITAMTLIPGSGEWVYDTQGVIRQNGVMLPGGTFAPGGYQDKVNMNSPSGLTDCVVALQQMIQTCPSVNWISVVVCWFATTDAAGTCQIFPGVEYTQGGYTSPEEWSCAGYTRSTAYAIAYEGGAPRYGGTPSDSSIQRLIGSLKAWGYKVAFYPMLMVDVPGKPWRGHMTGSAAEVSSFFTRSNGYNRFIQHYANLCTGMVDAFIIGSEMKGLTSVAASAGNYPAVTQLINLAGTVRSIVGPSVTLTYAADWSEYHHTTGGWYNLDALWASSYINVVGIDAYFPLTDSAADAQNLDAIRAGWTSGEGWDWEYTDSTRTTKIALTASKAWKNLHWWWSNAHTQPNGSTSAWVPGSKPIWFTEIGYPSVDGASNQPNVFYDPNSLDGGLPHFSRGSMDLRAQRLALQAAIEQWKGSSMVQRMFFWTWDARPYPQWPDRRDVWNDGRLWAYGHWLQGKLGVSHVGALVQRLCQRAGLTPSQMDMSTLNFPIDGMAITEYGTIREVIEALQQAFFFDLVDSGTKLVARLRAEAEVATVADAMLLPLSSAGDGQNGSIEQVRTQSVELPVRVEVQHISRSRQFETGVQRAVMPSAGSTAVQTIALPLSLSDVQAYTIAQTVLTERWLQRTQVRLRMNASQLMVEPGDRLLVTGEQEQRLRVIATRLMEGHALEIDAVVDAPDMYPTSLVGDDQSPPTQLPPSTAPTRLLLADLPNLPTDNAGDAYLVAAMAPEGKNWRGAELWRENSDGNPQALVRTSQSACMGTAIEVLTYGPHTIWDNMTQLVVQLLNDDMALSGASEEAVMNGANLALVGEELIQFRHASVLGGGQYRISGMLRGRLGTEDAINSHVAGDRFLLLSGPLLRMPMASALIGMGQNYRGVTIGTQLSDATLQNYIWRARGLKPYAPAHLRAYRKSNGDLLLRWIRRVRAGGEWRDAVDIPLLEEREAYRLRLLSTTGGTLIRQWEPGESSVTYTAAEQASDFGTLAPNALAMRLVQLSAVAGEGVARETTVYVEAMP